MNCADQRFELRFKIGYTFTVVCMDATGRTVKAMFHYADLSNCRMSLIQVCQKLSLVGFIGKNVPVNEAIVHLTP